MSRPKFTTRKRTIFFEHLPQNQKTPSTLVDEVDELIRDIWRHQEDPQSLSETLQKLAVKNAGLGNLLIEALDIERQAETAYKYAVEKRKLELIDKGDSATAAESKAKVENKEKLDEWNWLQKNVDVVKIKRNDVGRVLDAVRTRISLIKQDIQS